MSKRVFISFLGVNDYINCNYYFKDKKIENVKYVQEALLKIFENDQAIIFLTSKAYERNWRGKLENILKNINHIQVISVNIPDGKSEKEIWEIFEIMYKNIPVDSEIIFDITHAFRSIPMLAITLLNYSKIMKNIKIKGIYYGAIETLGTFNKIKELPIKERNAPIFNLTSFAKLIEWTNASYDFLKYGVSVNLKDLILEQTKPILKEKKGKDETAKNLKFIGEKLNEITTSFSTVRGRKILNELDFTQLKQYIDKEKENIKIKPIVPLIDKTFEKINNFETNNIKNLFYAAKWCFEHNMIQQSITILQEAIITYFCNYYKLDYKNKLNRELISQIFNIKMKNIPIESWSSPAKENVDFVTEKLKELNDKIVKLYNQLSIMRNDINHAGFLENAQKIEGFYKTKDIINKTFSLLF